jgi:catalase
MTGWVGSWRGKTLLPIPSRGPPHAQKDSGAHKPRDNQNSLKAGLRGPTLLEDFILREKITHFDHERIPERIVHARGSARTATSSATSELAALTRAAPFQEPARDAGVRALLHRGRRARLEADTARDVRGFAVKFYTDEGNWDLVGNNIPVFFIQDAMKFPDLVHAVKPEPHHGCRRPRRRTTPSGTSSR